MRKFTIGQDVKVYPLWGKWSNDGKIIDTKYVGLFKRYGVEYAYDASDEEDGPVIKKKVDWFSPYDIFNCDGSKSDAIIVSRQMMRHSDKRYNDSYFSDFEFCNACYEYLNKAFSQIKSVDSNIDRRSLSDRNIACMTNVLLSLNIRDIKSYWHELADFIHNYNSQEPVSYHEYQLFKIMFDVGKDVHMNEKE